MDFYSLALKVNESGWRVVNCFQVSNMWRVNLQLFTERGASTEYFSEFADAEDPVAALEAAFKNANARYPKSRAAVKEKPRKTYGPELTDRQSARIERAIMNLYVAVKMDRS